MIAKRTNCTFLLVKQRWRPYFPVTLPQGGIAKVPTSQRSSILFCPSLCLLSPFISQFLGASLVIRWLESQQKKDLFEFDARRERQSVLVQNYIIYCCFECNLYNSFTFMSVLCLLSVNNDQSAAINVRLAMHTWWCYLEITLITGTKRNRTFARVQWFAMVGMGGILRFHRNVGRSRLKS